MKFTSFRIKNFRNIHDSGLILIDSISAFVGQNEAGKSNLFEALYLINPFVEDEAFDVDEDWPVDQWGDKDPNESVCWAYFDLTIAEIADLVAFAIPTEAEVEGAADGGNDGGTSAEVHQVQVPESLRLTVVVGYQNKRWFEIDGPLKEQIDKEKLSRWAKANLPKFVYIHDYDLSGHQIELNQLQERIKQVGVGSLSNEEQTIKVVLDLAQIDLDEFVKKGTTTEGRTTRSFDKRAASKYLSDQFAKLWSQKAVRFDIDIDGPTLNIFVEDEDVGMPVRLKRRSTGFRWYVSFAWRFTHASRGEFENCILLLEEPGIHLHFNAQRDLLEVFERLSATNTLLYTTHLASMVDLATPERVRLVEYQRATGTTVKRGVVSSQRAPMAVIEASLGLTGNLSGLLGNRNTLIVEGADDALILNKLSGVLRAGSREHLSDSIFLWPAEGASKTPMYAAFAIGQGWPAGVLLDSDEAGLQAKKKISELHLNGLAAANDRNFRVLLVGDAAGINKTDAAIEELFTDEFYLDIVNSAYGLAIKIDELPQDGSDMITSRVEHVLKAKHGRSALDKGLVMQCLFDAFDKWTKPADLPKGTAAKADKLFKKINKAFGVSVETTS